MSAGLAHPRLIEALHQVAHHLPGQAPLREFVHHNTLHGDEAAGFVQASRAAARRTGARVWPSHAHLRAALAEGRLHTGQVERVIAQLLPPEIPPKLAWGEGWLETAALLAAALVHDLAPSPGAWSHERWRERSAQPRTARSPDPIWEACLAARRVDPWGRHPEELLELHPDEARRWTRATAGRAPWSLIERAVDQQLEAWFDRGEATLDQVLSQLTGRSVDDEVAPTLSRWLSSWLDEEVASLTWPDRELGFWASWRRAAPWLGLPAAGVGLAAALPDEPQAALESLLDRLGVPPDRWAVYLERTALRLPGFAGQAAWREAHPTYPDQRRAPLHLADLLAVWLTVALDPLDDALREAFGVGANRERIARELRGRPAEVYARLALHRGLLPEALADAVRAAASGHYQVRTPGMDPWREVAERVQTWQALAGDAETPGPLGEATLLDQLARRLGWTAGQIQAATPAQQDDLLRTLARFDDDLRGLARLEALEAGYREALLAGLRDRRARGLRSPATPRWQVVACIDDREEAWRRALEQLDPEVETLGAAGFFGVAVRYRALGAERPVPLCPVVIDPPFLITEVPVDPPHPPPTAEGRWARFLRESPLAPWLAPLAGPLAAYEQVKRTFLADPRPSPPLASRTRLVARCDAPDPHRTPDTPQRGFSAEEAADRVAALLRNVGIAHRLAALVVLVGHGSSSRNNPHRAAYDCGACGGRHGGPNARLFAQLANDPEVRALLPARGVTISDETWFVGAAHDTATEAVEAYDLDLLPPSHQGAWRRAAALLDQAGDGSALERCRKFAHARPDLSADQARRHVIARANDWSQARPELGHATNAAAVVGRRALTRDLFLDRRTFLVSYDPSTDPTGGVLEGILLAVGPVGAGINLEYYFSTCDDQRLGCGSKTPHNLLGGIGVLEGTAGDLRTGLPRQMTEIHEPVRLLLVVEASPDVLAAIYARQAPLRELLDGGWVLLVSLHPTTGATQRFHPGRGFLPEAPGQGPTPQVPDAARYVRGHLGLLPPALLEATS